MNGHFVLYSFVFYLSFVFLSIFKCEEMQLVVIAVFNAASLVPAAFYAVSLVQGMFKRQFLAWCWTKLHWESCRKYQKIYFYNFSLHPPDMWFFFPDSHEFKIESPFHSNRIALFDQYPRAFQYTVKVTVISLFDYYHNVMCSVLTWHPYTKFGFK